MAITKATASSIAPAAKGDLVVGSATNDAAVLGVGTNDQVLTADSSTATGLKWAAAGGGGSNWSLLNSGGTSLSGSSTTVSGISAKDKIFVLVENFSGTNTFSTFYIRLNSDTGSNYYMYGPQTYAQGSYAASIFDPNSINDTGFRFGAHGSSATGLGNGYAIITGCNASGVKMINYASAVGTGGGDQNRGVNFGGYYNSSSTISSVTIRVDSGTLDNGTVYVYTSA